MSDIISIGYDFMEAVYVYMTEKYIIYILEELGFINKEPTSLYCDNKVDIIKDKYKRPTEIYM